MTATLTLPRTAKPSGLTMEIVQVTPQMAEAWLGKNVKNRHLRQALVKKYAQAMARAEWMITGEAVKFAATGELLDGQHRLAAIVQSGKTVPLLVVRGLHESTQNVMDSGSARTAADALSIHGFSNPNVLAAAARIAILYGAGFADTKTAVSHTQIMDFCQGNTMLVFAATQGQRVSKSAEMQPSIAAFCFYELMKIDDQKAQEFFDRLADGTNLPSGSPILALRARLRSLRDERTRLPMEASVSLVFRTWNAWRAGRKLTALPLYNAGKLIACPEPK